MRLRRLMIFGVLLFMVVGFAAVSTTFNFKGIASIAANEDDFRVSLRKAKLDGIDIAPTAISTDGLKLKYTIEELKLAGDSSILEFAITNNSKLYDAKMQLNCDELEVDDTKLEVKMDADRVNAGENVLGSVVVTLNKDVPEDATEPLKVEVSCRLKLTALERTEKGEDAPDLEDTYYKENFLNGADPVLADNMIPVVLADDGTVTYANKNTRWYKYATKEWANAVILKDDIDSMYNVGNIIKEEDIEAYFVWIPRYRYKLWNVSDTSVKNADLDEENQNWLLKDAAGNLTGETVKVGSSIKTIEVVFESRNTKPSVGTKDGEWLTHPAFTSLDVNGIWVGKFETGVESATTSKEAELATLEVSSVIIKPNSYIWRASNTSGAYNTSLAYKPSLNSHLIKNTEWGAITYLTLSNYGVGIDIGNASKVTSGKKDTNLYNTEEGVKASTTGNISGVYDMVGGVGELVASIRENEFKVITEEQYNAHPEYVDVYPMGTASDSYQYRILGDATGEIGPFYNTGTISYNNWNKGAAIFVNDINTQLIRGGLKPGILSFENKNIQTSVTTASRIVLGVKSE